MEVFLGGFMLCVEHRRLENDVARAESALETVTSWKMSPASKVPDQEFRRLGALATDANYKLRTHASTCPECRKEDDPTAG
jgi:hypothetical protein